MNIITFLVWLTFVLLFSSAVVWDLSKWGENSSSIGKIVSGVFVGAIFWAIVSITIGVFSGSTKHESLWWLLFVVPGLYLAFSILRGVKRARDKRAAEEASNERRGAHIKTMQAERDTER